MTATPETNRPALASWGVMLLVALVQAAYGSGFEMPGRTARLMVLFAAPALLAAGGCVAWSRCRRTVLLAGLGGGTLAIATISALSNASASRFVAADLWFLVSLAAVVWLVHLNPGPGLDRALSAGALLGLVFVVPFALYEAFVGTTVMHAAVQPPAGAYVNRNVAAQAMVLLVPLAAAARAPWSHRFSGWFVAIASLAGVLLVATRSRGALLASLVGWGVAALAFAWVTRSAGRARRPALAGMAVLAAAMLAAAFVPVRGAQELPSVVRSVGLLVEGNEPAQGVRVALWANTAAMIGRAPFLGVGPGRFAVEYPLVHDAARPTPEFGLEHRPEHAHNDLLEFAGELGLPAALLLVTLFAGGCVLALRDLQRAATRGWREAVVPAAALAALLGIGLHGMVSFPWHSPASALVGAVVLGRCWGSRAETRFGCGVAMRAAIALVLLAVGGWIAVKNASGQAGLAQGLRSFANENCVATVEHARAVAEVTPSRRDLALAATLTFECETDAEKSLELLDRALEHDPHNVNLLLAAGARRIKAGRLDDADRALSHALKILPGLGRAWLGMAMVHQARGDEVSFAAACDRALVLAPDLAATQSLCGASRRPGRP